MASTAKQMPGQNRSGSEIAFVLRRAKWRQGPEVMRALAGGETAETAGVETAPKRKPAKAPRQRAKDR